MYAVAEGGRGEQDDSGPKWVLAELSRAVHSRAESTTSEGQGVVMSLNSNDEYKLCNGRESYKRGARDGGWPASVLVVVVCFPRAHPRRRARARVQHQPTQLDPHTVEPVAPLPSSSSSTPLTPPVHPPVHVLRLAAQPLSRRTARATTPLDSQTLGQRTHPACTLRR